MVSTSRSGGWCRGFLFGVNLALAGKRKKRPYDCRQARPSHQKVEKGSFSKGSLLSPFFPSTASLVFLFPSVVSLSTSILPLLATTHLPRPATGEKQPQWGCRLNTITGAEFSHPLKPSRSSFTSLPYFLRFSPAHSHRFDGDIGPVLFIASTLN